MIASFCNQWTGRTRPITLHKRSPDLMPLDVFVYGYVRHIVCAQKSLDICHLRDNLWNAMNVGGEAKIVVI
jgi:hypothetical protein